MFKKYELENQYMSKLTAFLAFQVHQVSNTREETDCFFAWRFFYKY